MDSKQLAQDIRAGLAARNAARNVPTLEKPAILSEQPPVDHARIAGWNALRQQTEEEYARKLLEKGSLTSEEQRWLAGEIGQAVRRELPQ